MESSSSEEEEGEITPQSITHYCCVDDANFSVSFASLPFYLDGMERVETRVDKQRVFLRGTADNGEKMYKLVCYWKFELLGDRRKLSVMTKGGKWIKLLRPRKAYEPCIRTVMIVMDWLRFLRREPDASRKRVWEHLERAFRASDVRPSENDLRDHVALIRNFFQRDNTLCTSQVLMEFLKETPVKRMDSCEVFQNGHDIRLPSTFNDDEMDEGEGGDDFEEESTLFDSVCALCDNEGEILCCEGQCLRSFHATKDSGTDSCCTSLCYSREKVEAINKFFCNNCLYKQHQCFACGKLGSSDRTAGPEVLRCVSATCGHFYHPKCVAKQLFPVNEGRTEHEKNIAFGEPFICPLHKCFHCKQGENKKIRGLQFASCRRCPKSYHRKCLPRQIAFENSENGSIQRAWDGLLPNRILMYCLDHRMDETLGTPVRNHIIFPEVPVKKKLVVDCRSKEMTPLKQNMVSDGLPISIKPEGITEKWSSYVGKSGESCVQKIHDVSRKGKSMKMTPKLEQYRFPVKEKTKSSIPTCRAACSGKKFINSFPAIDAETEMRMAHLLEEASTSVSFEDVTRKCSIPSIYKNYTTQLIDKNITMGKVEGSVQAIKTALASLQNGSSIEDATAICEPEVLRQLSKWRSKLNVYLSPFLLGTRYTSFGRHFTKVDKLEEIVDRLQWYIQNGDWIVDFCCGANDFSTLLKRKLDDAGKICAFKNYDIICPKNEFSFEKRDWMTVQPSELPNGSELIIGLNPPFGVKASLANKFVNKALSFMPKLLILIVPEETERPDKNGSYDLIWSDVKKLSGKSFYLPGSVDVKDAQLEQWNSRPPPLYLWSRRDWTMKHKEIAIGQGHLSIEHADSAKETQRELCSGLTSVEANSSSVWRGNERRYDKPYENKSPQADREEGELSDMSISPPPSSVCNCEGQYPPEGIILPQRGNISGPFGFKAQMGQCPESGTFYNKDPAVVASRYQTHSRTENCHTIQSGNVDHGIHSSEGHPYIEATRYYESMHESQRSGLNCGIFNNEWGMAGQLPSATHVFPGNQTQTDYLRPSNSISYVNYQATSNYPLMQEAQSSKASNLTDFPPPGSSD